MQHDRPRLKPGVAPVSIRDDGQVGLGLAREKWRAIALIYAAASNAHGLWKSSAECRRIGL